MLENYANEMAKTAADEDNIRVYIPLDINRRAIRRRLNAVIIRYGEVSEKNECQYPFETIDELKREYLQMTEQESYSDL